MPRLTKMLLITASILLFPAIALAVDMDFYTYGGLEPVVDAFTQLALIFGDSSYQSLYYTVVICGIGGGAMFAYMMLIGGRGGHILGWAPVAALGIAIYVGLFVPKGNIVVYDPVVNNFQTVGNVPNGVVIVAGTLNAIERGLVSIISNSSSPTAYQTQAGGVGFFGLFDLVTVPSTATSSYLDMNIHRYIKDCVSFALNNPASGLTVDELRKTTTNFATSFAKAQNLAIMTVYYDAADPQGTPIDCSSDWTTISTNDLTPAALSKNIESVCSTLNFDVTVPVELAQCQTDLGNIATSGNLTTGTLNDFMQQTYLYNQLDQYYQSGNTTALTNYGFLMNASGSMKAAQEWLPILKAVLTAVAVSLIPLLAIFIPTPICGRALNLMFGMFLWLAIWGVCDAIMHQYAVSYGFKVWDEIRTNNLGMDAFYFFPNMTVKTLAMFSTLRIGGLLLATVITTMLTRFGGSVMGMLAGNITGQIQSAGIGAEKATSDPAGRAAAIDANTRSLPTEAWAATHSLTDRGGEVYASKSGGTQAYSNLSHALGGPNGVAAVKAEAEEGLTVGRGGTGLGMEAGPGGLQGALTRSTFMGTGEQIKGQDITSAYGTPGSWGHTQSASAVGTANVAQANSKKPEELTLSREMYSQSMGYGEQSNYKQMSGISDDIAAGGALGGAKATQDMQVSQHAAQVRAAANNAFPDSWKSNPDLYDLSKKEAKPLGVGVFIGAMEGKIGYSTAHGRGTQELTSGGELIRSSEEGTFTGNDLHAFAASLDKAGLHQEASALRSAGTVNIGASYDSHGHPVTAVGSSGGRVEHQDRGIDDRGQTVRHGDNVHVGNVSRHGNDTHDGNVLRKGDDTHVGDSVRSGNDFDSGNKSRTGDLETKENFPGEVGGHNFENATYERRGNNFTVSGATTDGGWEVVSGHVTKGANGAELHNVVKGQSDSGMGFTPQSAMDSVLNKHSVPESAMRDDQTKQAFAEKYAQGLQQLRDISTAYAKESSGGGAAGFGQGMAENTTHPRINKGLSSSQSINGGFTLGSIYKGTNQENINIQYREIRKVLDRHENTPEGRQSAASELLKMHDDNASHSSNRLMDLFHGGAWERKK